MTAPVLNWSDDFEQSKMGPGVERFVTLTITSDANGQWDAGGYALPALAKIRLGDIISGGIEAIDSVWLVGTAGVTHTVLPLFDYSTSPPKVKLYKAADGAEYTQTATNFANKNLSFKLRVRGTYEA